MKVLAGLPVAIGVVEVGSEYHCRVPFPEPVSVTDPGPHRLTLLAVGAGIVPMVMVSELDVSLGQPTSVTMALNVVDTESVTA
jgi:hypothetical protein